MTSVRSFQRTGPTIVLQLDRDRVRLVKGPAADGPGDIVTLDTDLGDSPVWVESLVSDPYFVEIVEKPEPVVDSAQRPERAFSATPDVVDESPEENI